MVNKVKNFISDTFRTPASATQVTTGKPRPAEGGVKGTQDALGGQGKKPADFHSFLDGVLQWYMNGVNTTADAIRPAVYAGIDILSNLLNNRPKSRNNTFSDAAAITGERLRER